jgi:uncharacterized protein (TIGR03437 family)
VDSTGAVWIAGGLSVAGAPKTVNPLFATGPAFISRFSADFTQLLFSTYFDSVAGLALDATGFAYVAGTGNYSTVTGRQPVYVAKIDATPPVISLDSIANAMASASPTNFRGIAAGELLRLLGRNMGPPGAVPGAIVSGALAETVAGVQVTFDGIPAPLLWVSSSEIDVVAPFELAAKSSTTVEVQYNGAKSNAVQIAVNSVDVQIVGPFNDDGTLNSQSNPATPGSVITIYVAGIGQTNPPGKNGQINAAPLAPPETPILVQWLIDNPNGQTSLPIIFVGAAPGLAAGVFQVNFVAPPQTLPFLDLVVGNNTYTPFRVFVQQ